MARWNSQFDPDPAALPPPAPAPEPGAEAEPEAEAEAEPASEPEPEPAPLVPRAPYVLHLRPLQDGEPLPEGRVEKKVREALLHHTLEPLVDCLGCMLERSARRKLHYPHAVCPMACARIDQRLPSESSGRP